VLSELNAETVLHYVIALEGLLAGDESDHTELTRKVSQRAAILAGKDPMPDGALREVADQALLSHELLERCVHQPLNEFSQRVRDE
jgi:hypothetical protein